MAKNKTTENTNSVTGFISSIADEARQSDCRAIVKLIKSETGFPPKMWGPSIIGFGSYHYKYESGREGDMPLVGFSPRKNEFAFYLSANFEKRDELLKKLGKHSTGKGCIYIKKLSDIDTDVLKTMVANSVKYRKSTNPA
jgi:hypothetical protein